MKIDQWGLRMFHAVVNVDNGMERFQWSGCVVSKNQESAIKHITKKYHSADQVQIVRIQEIELRDGMVLQAVGW